MAKFYSFFAISKRTKALIDILKVCSAGNSLFCSTQTNLYYTSTQHSDSWWLVTSCDLCLWKRASYSVYMYILWLMSVKASSLCCMYVLWLIFVKTSKLFCIHVHTVTYVCESEQVMLYVRTVTYVCKKSKLCCIYILWLMSVKKASYAVCTYSITQEPQVRRKWGNKMPHLLGFNPSSSFSVGTMSAKRCHQPDFIGQSHF